MNDLVEKIMLLYLKHNLTLVCLEDVMKLINENLEDCKKFPTGKVQIMNMFREHRDLVDIFYFIKCTKCKKYSKAENKIAAKCSRCGNGIKFTETNYFVNLPVEQQIVKSIKENWSYIQNFAIDRDTEKTMISDAYDGEILRKILEKYRDSDVNILSLTINVDGANKFRSNTKSVWPIQLVQNYLPPSIRFLPQNVIVNGLQYVSSKDDDTDDLNFREFLLPLVNELNNLKTNIIQIEIDNENYSFKPIITHAAVDLPAKSKFAEMKQCGGYDRFGCFGYAIIKLQIIKNFIVHSCTFCEIPGEQVEVENLVVKKRVNKKASKKPNSETALAKKPKTFVRYVQGDYKIRDEVETLKKMLLASESNGQSIDGVKGKNPLIVNSKY